MTAAFPRTIRLIVIAMILVSTLVLSGNPVPVAAQEGEVLLEDQFDSNDNDWELSGLNEDYVDLDIDDGVLAISIDREDNSAWTFVTPDATFPNDVDVMVDIEAPDAGDAYWYAALVLRGDMREDSDDKYTGFYHFEVTSKGEWGFAARWDDPDDEDNDDKTVEYNLIKNGKLSSFDPEDSHTLAVSARGNEFEFVIDGKKVGTFEDDNVNDNDDPKYVGVLAGTLEGFDDEVTVTFDNFIVQGTEAGGSDNTNTSGALLQENFEGNTNGWAVSESDTSSVEIDDNMLTMKVFEGSEDGLLRWAGPNKELPGDVDVTVSAAVDESETTGAWYYGVGVRFYTEDDTARYYMLVVTHNEEWVFADFDGQKLNPIERGDIADFDAGSTNKVNIIANGNTFEFYFNGKKLGEVEDDKLEEQDTYNMVLAVGSLDEDSSVTVNFSNLIVLEP